MNKFSLLFILLLSGVLHAQTLVPGSLGSMSSTQPDRNTAILSGNLLRTGGQDPTIKIVWGDEDRGADASALSTWDNTVVISTNQGVGSFSTTITIPNQEKIYYFRSVAENAGGTVVSRSLGVFTPSALVGVSDLKGRWSFDDDNFSSLESCLLQIKPWQRILQETLIMVLFLRKFSPLLHRQISDFGWMLMIHPPSAIPRMRSVSGIIKVVMENTQPRQHYQECRLTRYPIPY